MCSTLSPLTATATLMSEQPRDLKSSSEDALKHLVNYDVVILMDDSGSMGYQAGPHKRRWDLVWNVVLSTVAGADKPRVRQWKSWRK